MSGGQFDYEAVASKGTGGAQKVQNDLEIIHGVVKARELDCRDLQIEQGRRRT